VIVDEPFAALVLLTVRLLPPAFKPSSVTRSAPLSLMSDPAMEPETDRRRPDTFVIQVTPTAAGDLAGLVRHVRTWERRQFEGLDGLGQALRSLADAARTGEDA